MEDFKTELASDLSREIARDIAPNELKLFDDFKEKFVKNPEAFVTGKGQKTKDPMLGFAVPGADPFIIPTILSVVWIAIDFIIKTGGEAAIKKLGEKLAENTADKIIKTDQSQGKRPLTNEQIKELKQYAISQAKIEKINEKKFSLIFDAVIGKINQM